MAERRILLGVVGRPHGVRGLVRVVSYTADPASLTAYGDLTDDRGRRFTLRWRGEGIAEIAEMVDGKPVPAADRNAAEKLVNTRLYIERARLPPPDEEEFYLADLVGLAAFDGTGAALGEVAAVHDYGAGASLEIARAEGAALLVPFTRAAVPEVDPAAGRLIVVPPDETAVPEQAA
jgi:16S rRNA processing protein RimM